MLLTCPAIVILYTEVVNAVFDGSFADCTEMGVASSLCLRLLLCDANSTCFADSWESCCRMTSANLWVTFWYYYRARLCRLVTSKVVDLVRFS